jgi:YD repeat-containing protein
MKKTPSGSYLSIKPLTLLLSLTLFLGACKEEQVILPRNETPPPTTPADPGNGQPDPGQQPNPLPTGKFVQLKWSESDFLRVDYDEAGLITRYVSQYNSVQGSSTVSNFTYEFQYDTNKRLVKETSNVHGTVHFFYNGSLLDKAIEYDKLDRPLKEYHYTYRADNKLETRVTYKVDLDNSKTEYQKQTYKYDARGNLVIMEDYFKNNTTDQFDLATRFFFEDFDDKKAAIPFLATFPYLPQFTSWVNNPGVKYAQNKDGYELAGRERYGYTYNAEGYPTTQTRSVNVGGGRPDFTYTGNFIYNLQ